MNRIMLIICCIHSVFFQIMSLYPQLTAGFTHSIAEIKPGDRGLTPGSQWLNADCSGHTGTELFTKGLEVTQARQLYLLVSPFFLDFLLKHNC